MNKNEYHILVIGASGILGLKICREIKRIFGENVKLYAGDYNHDRGIYQNST